MKTILLRAPKHPLKPVSAVTTLRRNLIGTNSGNLIFIDAAHKLLSVPDVEVLPDRFKTDPALADEINERYDAYVIPLANAFRLSFEPKLVRMTRLIEKLRIPVIVLGVGAQANVDYDLRRLKPIEGSVRAFVSAVLDRSASIGVRGELTETYLRQLGFHDVDVIGCPSMFLYGPSLNVEKRVGRLGKRSRIAVNVSPNLPQMAEAIRTLGRRYPKLRYVAQDIGTLELLLRGDQAGAPKDDLPIPRDHPIIRRNRVRFYVDPWPWIKDLRAFDFSFGSRIHGNIAPLLAGTPAFVLAHDSRTLELARYFHIPHRVIPAAPDAIDVEELYASADYGELNGGHAARFAAFAGYLARNGLADVFSAGDGGRHFDDAISALRFAPAVDAHRIADAEEGLQGVLQRTTRLRRRARARLRSLPRRLTARTTSKGRSAARRGPDDQSDSS